MERPIFSPQNLFDLFDKNQDGKIGLFETYAVFQQADADRNAKLAPAELIKWMEKNRVAICTPYK